MFEIKQGQEVICGDSLEIMRTMPDKCFNLVLCDPPYGIGIDGSDESIVDGVQIRKKYEWGGVGQKHTKQGVFY